MEEPCNFAKRDRLERPAGGKHGFPELTLNFLFLTEQSACTLVTPDPLWRSANSAARNSPASPWAEPRNYALIAERWRKEVCVHRYPCAPQL